MNLIQFYGAMLTSSRRARRRESSGTAPSFSAAPSIIGTPLVGTPVSYTPGVVAGLPAPSVTRQWLLNGVAISGATNLTYTPVAGDAGQALSVRETATNVNGSVSSTSATVNVTSVPAFTAAPVILGTPTAGTPVAFTQGTVTGSPTPTRTRQWLRNGVAISGATGTTYTPVEADIGTGILSVRETATNSAGAANSTSTAVNVAAAAPVWTVAPAIIGTPQVSVATTASTGTVTGIPTPTISYQWTLNGSNISGATAATYTPITGDVGGALRRVTTATNAGGTVSSTSAPVTVIAAGSAPGNTVLPAITGVAQQGQVLSASTGTWTGSPSSYAYQWLRAGVNISGATSSTYTAQAADVGQAVSVRVTATNAFGSTPATSATVNVTAGSGSATTFDALYAPGFTLSALDTQTPTVFARPAKSNTLATPSYTDPAYGTKVWRMTNASTEGTSGAVSQALRHDYSRRQAFNADNTKVLIRESDGGIWYIYDATTFTKVNMGGAGGRVPFMAGDDTEPLWHPTDPNILWYWGGGLIWYQYSFTTGTSTVLVNFTGRLPWAQAEWVWTKAEGCTSADGRYWGLLAMRYDTGSQTNICYGLLCWDRQTDTIVGTLSASAFGNSMPDHVSISPSGNYVVPSWAFTPSLGTRAYTRDFSSNRQLRLDSQHSDLAFGPNGEDLLVYADYDSGSADAGWIVAVNCANGAVTRLCPIWQSGTDYSCHISGKAINRPGWVVVSTYESLVSSPFQPQMRKVFALELKASPRMLNIAHTRCAAGYGGYYGEIQATVNRDFTRVVFASNFNSGLIESWMVGLPSTAIPA